MHVDFTGLSVSAQAGCEKAAALFCDEIERRTGRRPANEGRPRVCFAVDPTLPNKDCYRIEQSDGEPRRTDLADQKPDRRLRAGQAHPRAPVRLPHLPEHL